MTATFMNTNRGLFVTLELPTGETSIENATGNCISEEDSAQLALRCPNVNSKSGKQYFVRIDGRKATIAQQGRIIDVIPCSGHL